jgi:serine/threonine protein kinase
MFNISPLARVNTSYNRNSSHRKYFISCEGRITKETPTTESWLKVLKLLKLDISDIDKSRILLGSFENNNNDIVIKVGNAVELEREYNFSRRLFSSKGFVKYICNFSCNDDFRTLPDPKRSAICHGPGNQMGVIVMPYFPLGSLAKYSWTPDNLQLLHTCIKHAMLSIISIYCKHNIIHGDFHPGNVLLKETKQREITYNLSNIGEITVPTYGIRTWIMDFENTSIADTTTTYGTIMGFNNFYFDISKFITALADFIKGLDPRSFILLRKIIDKQMMQSKMFTMEQLLVTMNVIENIKFFHE